MAAMEDVLFEAQALMLTTAARWMLLAEKIPVGRLTRAPALGEWAAIDCLRHLLDTESGVFPQRLRLFLAGQDIPAFDPATQGKDYGDTPAPRLAAEFARLRAQNLAALEQVRPLDLARTVQHSDLGPVTLGQMLHEWAAHDLAHLMQAERALIQPFIAGSGPWRVHFQDQEFGPH